VIEIECDNCERTFEARPQDAGGKVPCPHCGDINRVPAAAAPDSAPKLDDGEQELSVVHPAMARAHPFRFLAVAALLIGGLVLAFASGPSDALWDWLAWPGWLMVAAAVVWWIAWYVAAHLWIKLTISNKRTVRQEGIVRRHTSEVLHEHVRNVEIKQSLTQRILNVGYLGISSAGQGDIEIEVKDIPRPYELKALIDEHRRM